MIRANSVDLIPLLTYLKVWILKEIPKTATGKIQRRKVADALLEKDKKAKL